MLDQIAFGDVRDLWFPAPALGPQTSVHLPRGRGYLYRAYSDTDVLLYVGITKCLRERWTVHKRTSEWWEQCATLRAQLIEPRWTLEAAERAAIRSERPLFNRRSAVSAA